MGTRLPKFGRKRRASGGKETIFRFPAKATIFDEKHPYLANPDARARTKPS